MTDQKDKTLSDSFGKAALPVSPYAPAFAAEGYHELGNCYTYALGQKGLKAFNPGQVRTTFNYRAYDILNLDQVREDIYFQNYVLGYAKHCSKGAVKDGLIALGKDPVEISYPENHSLAAMVIMEHDGLRRALAYHWYRQDAGGLWSHRRGYNGIIDNKDDAGEIIRDPRTASRGMYNHFEGFFLVPKIS